jgi:hypothetical protein
MPDAIWPASVPPEPEVGTYSEGISSNLASDALGGAFPSAWQRSTVRGTVVRGTWLLTSSQLGTFQTFFGATLREGVLPFAWVNPAHTGSVAGRYLFDPENPPEWKPVGVGSLYQLSLSFLKLK